MSVDMGYITVSNEVRVRTEAGHFVSALTEGATRAAAALADEIVALAIVNAPKDTGMLALSIEPVYQGTSAFAYATAPHAAPQEKGAGPHDIPGSFGREPPWGFGAAWGRPGAWHPGNPATHFMENAGRMVSREAIGIIRRYLP